MGPCTTIHTHICLPRVSTSLACLRHEGGTSEKKESGMRRRMKRGGEQRRESGSREVEGRRGEKWSRGMTQWAEERTKRILEWGGGREAGGYRSRCASCNVKFGYLFFPLCSRTEKETYRRRRTREMREGGKRKGAHGPRTDRARTLYEPFPWQFADLLRTAYGPLCKTTPHRARTLCEPFTDRARTLCEPSTDLFTFVSHRN